MSESGLLPTGEARARWTAADGYDLDGFLVDLRPKPCLLPTGEARARGTAADGYDLEG